MDAWSDGLKICPTCNSRYATGESFCPQDGSKLVEAKDISPGQLTGGVLGEVVKLDRLVHVDLMAERYVGRMVESRKPVAITVFNQLLAPVEDAEMRMETARSLVGSPLPAEINTALETHLDHTPPFIIHSEPRGPSVRELLDERQKLPWSSAVRIIASVARAIEWLAEQGIPSRSIHPGAIYVTDLTNGKIQLGEWAYDALIKIDSPERALAENANKFVGHVHYMAPELATSLENGDGRSAVYGLGVMLFEMVAGKPPLTASSPLEILKRHQHEKPLKLQIAASGVDVHNDLDDVIQMMMAKVPDSRFQTPAAVIAVLSNLLDSTPDMVAPALKRSEETHEDDLYRTIDMESVERGAVPGLKPPAKPPAKKPDTKKRDSGSVIVDPSISGKTGAVSGVSQTQESKAAVATKDANGSKKQVANRESVKQTLMMGSNVSDALEELAAKKSLEAESQKKTMALGSLSTESSAANFDLKGKVPKPTLAEPPPKASTLGEESSRAEIINPKKIKSKKSDAAEDKTVEAKMEDVTLEGKSPEFDAGPTAITDATPAPSPDLLKTEKIAPVKPAREGFDAGPTELTKKPGSGSRRIGEFTGEFSKEWFQSSEEDVWDQSIAAEHEQSTEKKFRTIGIIVFALIALVVAGFVIYTQFLYSPDDGENAVAETPEKVKEKEEKPAYDVANAKSAFESAAEDDRLVSPIGNSALTVLEEMKRRAPESAEYETVRKSFVEKAHAKALEAKKQDDVKGARDLAGYASQFDPENQELIALRDEMQRAFLGTDTQTNNAVVAVNETATQEDPVEAPEEKPEEVVPKEETKKDPKKIAKKDPKKEKKKDPEKEAPKVDTSKLISQAKSAYSRGQTDAAEKLYKKALKSSPKNHKIHAGLGKIYFDRASYSQAVKYQSNAVRYRPGSVPYRISLGQSYYRLGKYREAIKAWESALKKDPNNTSAKKYIELAKRKLN